MKVRGVFNGVSKSPIFNFLTENANNDYLLSKARISISISMPKSSSFLMHLIVSGDQVSWFAVVRLSTITV